jgi:hypothetical protein
MDTPIIKKLLLYSWRRATQLPGGAAMVLLLETLDGLLLENGSFIVLEDV